MLQNPNINIESNKVTRRKTFVFLGLKKHIKDNILNKHISEDYWWKAKDRKKFHVRPKAQKSSDLAPTPEGGWAKKFCYWFNNDYVRNIVDERRTENEYRKS